MIGAVRPKSGLRPCVQIGRKSSKFKFFYSAMLDIATKTISNAFKWNTFSFSCET